jgi:transcriptional regulator with XRE-family HTH domain
MKKRLELKAARARRGWTQLHLAIAVGVTQQTIAKWETGQNSPKTFAQMRRVAQVLGAPMNTIFADILGEVAAGE